MRPWLGSTFNGIPPVIWCPTMWLCNNVFSTYSVYVRTIINNKKKSVEIFHCENDFLIAFSNCLFVSLCLQFTGRFWEGKGYFLGVFISDFLFLLKSQFCFCFENSLTGSIDTLFMLLFFSCFCAILRQTDFVFILFIGVLNLTSHQLQWLIIKQRLIST